jgi:hypothetical protein
VIPNRCCDTPLIVQLLRRRRPRTGSSLQHGSIFGIAATLLWACDTYTPDLLEGIRTDPLDSETNTTEPDNEPPPATGSSPSTPSTPATPSMVPVVDPEPNPGPVGSGGGGNSGSAGAQGGAGNAGAGTGSGGTGGALPPVGSGGVSPVGTGGTTPAPSGSAGSQMMPSPSGGGGSMPGPGPTVVIPTTNPRLIDDFEDNNNALAMVDGRMGYWFISGSAEGTIDPNPFAVSPLDPTNPENAASTRGVHVTAVDFTAGDAAYALVGVNLNGEEMPYPGAANYSGIQFWARSSGGAGANIIAVKLPTAATQADSDHFGFHSVPLTDQWQQFLIPFDHAMLVQQGFGAAQVFDPAELISIQFSLAPGSTGFDVWIDDVMFAE